MTRTLTFLSDEEENLAQSFVEENSRLLDSDFFFVLGNSRKSFSMKTKFFLSNSDMLIIDVRNDLLRSS